MAIKEHVNIILRGVKVWNNWRETENIVRPDLSGIDLSGQNLDGVNFCRVDLSYAKLNKISMQNADLRHPILDSTNLMEANLSHSNLLATKFRRSYLIASNLSYSNMLRTQITSAFAPSLNIAHSNIEKSSFSSSDLTFAKINSCTIKNSDFFCANLRQSDFSESELNNCRLENCILVSAKVENLILSNCNVHGISVWALKGIISHQNNLQISSSNQPAITVDDVHLAQFIFLLLDNNKIQNAISTISNKGVLILGRFKPERKKVLDAIRLKLKSMNYVPIMFDFDKSESKDFTETIKILAGLSRFVIVDITDPSSSPLELQATIPNYMIPFVPIIEKGHRPFSMFIDFITKYDKWVMNPIEYESIEELMDGFDSGIVNRALELEKRLLRDKVVTKIDLRRISDFD